MYKNLFKRIIDFSAALIGLILLFPIIFLISLILFFTYKGNPFFFQPRPGKNEKIFNIIKFKSMTDKKDENGDLLPDYKRITPIGTFIRKYSLDELPQLINVFIGHMSLIGPRPLRVRYLPFYTIEEGIRHTVKPGVTGLAQVSGRNLLSWDEKLKIDIKYVNEITFLLDLKILFLTIKKILSPQGIELNPNTLNFDEYRMQKNKINSTN